MNLRYAAPLVMLLAVGGCKSLQPVEAPGDYIAAERPNRVVVIDTYGEPLVLQRPEIAGDSLYGNLPGANARVGLRLAELNSVQARQVNPLRTGLFVGGLAAVGSWVAYSWLIDHTPHECEAIEHGEALPDCTPTTSILLFSLPIRW